MVYSTDDLSVKNLEYFKYWDLVKVSKPDLKVIAFTIAENLPTASFIDWFETHRDWVEIGVHCFNHQKPQEGWREDQRFWIERALKILKPFLPNRYLYRPPGFRFLPMTEKILKELGFSGIAHQEFIKYFDTQEKIPVFNTHCTFDLYANPIGKIWKEL